MTDRVIIPMASWDVFDECPECYAGPGMPCLRLNSSTKDPKINSMPHRGRKLLKKV